MWKYSWVFILLSCLSIFVGCGTNAPTIGEVQGVVTMDGKPLSNAVVFFEQEGARGSMGVTDSQGQYTLLYLREIEGAVVGSHRVSISSASEEDLVERIPAIYNKKSTLTREVVAGLNELNFELNSTTKR